MAKSPPDLTRPKGPIPEQVEDERPGRHEVTIPGAVDDTGGESPDTTGGPGSEAALETMGADPEDTGIPVPVAPRPSSSIDTAEPERGAPAKLDREPSSSISTAAGLPLHERYPGRSSGGRYPQTTPGTPIAAVLDRQRQVQRAEHLSEVTRIRKILPIAMVLWMGFFFVDWMLATFIAPGDLLDYFILRVIGLGPLGFVYWRLRQEPRPTPNGLRVLDLIMTCTTAGILSGMCLLSGGIDSLYAFYIGLVLVGRGAVTPDHWKRGIVQVGVPALLHPAILITAALVSPAFAAEFGNATAVSTFVFNLMFLFAAWIIIVFGGHGVWALRRQVFESRSIGRYRLKKCIGEGGMGEVWVAYHDGLKRDVALKILRPEIGTDTIAVARFEREVSATTELSHPNTVRIFDHGVTEDGIWYYAMELLDGTNLATLIELNGPLPASRAIYLVRQAARALSEAHKRGIVHRDVKPHNLFVTTLGGERDFIKVLDFGVVKFAEGQDSQLTSTGMLTGTPAYAAPEIASGGDAGPPADVYGLGAVLYCCVAGTPPFKVSNAMKMLFLHMNEIPQTPSERLGKPIPADLEAVIMRCLEKEPGDRYADAAMLARALDNCESAHKWTPTSIPLVAGLASPNLDTTISVGEGT